MNISDFGLPPERVREIATHAAHGSGGEYTIGDAECIIEISAPEVARAVLEWAAKRCDPDNLPSHHDRFVQGYMDGRLACARLLRQMAKEIKP